MGGTEPLIVNVNSTGGVDTLDKTWQEIHDAFVGGQAVIVYSNIDGYNSITSVGTRTNITTGTTIYAVGKSNNSAYTTDSANGYPQNNPFG